jgi:hypothetical protein
MPLNISAAVGGAGIVSLVLPSGLRCVEAAGKRGFGAPSLGQFVNWKIKPHDKYKRVG